MFDNTIGSNAFGNLLGGASYSPFGYLIGIAQHPQQLAAMQQQQAMFDPFGYQRLQAQYSQMAQMEKYNLGSAMQGMMFSPPSKHVESRDITPREKARKAINGAVQAVREAQKKG